MIRGKVREYLGMILYYTIRVQVKIMMLSYIDGIISSFDESYPKGKVTKSSAAPNNIFVVNKDYKKMDQEKVVEFHNLAANTLYANKRSRPDTCISIAFLTAGVQTPNKDNWYKLVHLM